MWQNINIIRKGKEVKIMLTNTVTSNELKKLNWKSWVPKRGEIYLVDLGEGVGSEQKYLRPAVVVSNNKNNSFSGVISVVPLTSKRKNELPVHVKLGVKDGLKNESIVCAEQIRSVDKSRAFINGEVIKITQLNKNKMAEIDFTIKIQLGLLNF